MNAGETLPALELVQRGQWHVAPAMADQFGLPVTSTPRNGLQGELAPNSATAAPCSSIPTASTSRRVYSKEELLAGSRRSCRRTSAVRRADPARRARHPSTCCKGGRSQHAAVKPRSLHQRARAGRRGVRCHTHTGEAGTAIRRRDGDAPRRIEEEESRFIGQHGCGHRAHYTTKNDEETVCHFCPKRGARRTSSTAQRAARRLDFPLIADFTVSEGDRRVQRSDARSRGRPARKSPASFRTWSTSS